MSNAMILKAKQHFANFRSPEKLVKIDVTEWGSSIWYWPHLSVGEKRAIENAASVGVTISDTHGTEQRRLKIDNLGRHITEILVRSRDEHGRLLFSESDFEAFLGVDPEIVRRVIAEMKDEYSSMESVEKN